MENLYEIKNRKEKIINQYSNEHDWEIGYQKFYEFLRNEFYNFIKNILMAGFLCVALAILELTL